jgi:hypothetical protein
MTIAEKKKNENIVEYLLYMWQIEDLVRAAKFDSKVYASFISSPELDDDQVKEELDWFEAIAAGMKKQGIAEIGHLEELKKLLDELGILHENILKIIQDKKYQKYYKIARPYIEEFNAKLVGDIKSDVECCVIGLYGLFVLRLKGRKVNEETQEAMKTFSDLMACLSAQYKSMKVRESRKNLN